MNEKLSSSYIIESNLLLETNQTEFQIDTLLIGKQTIYLLEAKNYEDAFYIKNDNWHAAFSHKEIRNPLHQLKRSELLLQNLLKNMGLGFSIQPYLVFMNPTFYLYQAPLDIPAVFPGQIERFINQLNTSPFEQTKKHRQIIHYLNDHRISKSRHARLPDYNYTDLKKGILCRHCMKFVSLSKSTNPYKVFCKNCVTEEKLEDGIIRNVRAFAYLFPEEKITTQSIHAWCDIAPTKKTIRRVLMKNLQLTAKGKYTHYTFKD